jgi:hypothetical protein
MDKEYEKLLKKANRISEMDRKITAIDTLLDQLSHTKERSMDLTMEFGDEENNHPMSRLLPGLGGGRSSGTFHDVPIKLVVQMFNTFRADCVNKRTKLLDEFVPPRRLNAPRPKGE